MAKQFIIGLDLGTTSVKACIFNRKGSLITCVEEQIVSYYPQQGWVEQQADEIEKLAVKAVRAALVEANVDKDELIALSFSAAMHSLLAVNEQGAAISPAIIWADGRASEQADKMTSTMKQVVYTRTGTPQHPMTPFMKLLWMKEQEYEPYIQAAYWMSIKEYLIYCWTNERVIDYSMASATGLFNPTELNWDPQVLDLVGVEANQLSRIVPPTTVLPPVKTGVAEAMGISPALPLVIGAADGQLANLGIGAISPGEVAVSVGTSGAIRQFSDAVKLSDKQETFCYAFTKDHYIIGGPTNNGGIVVQWLKELLEDERDFGEFLRDAEQVEPGADGLLFLPYINGERAPIWNQRAKGSFYGVTVTHKKAHFIRAVLEGITFNLYQIHRALTSSDQSIQTLYVNGGLSRSPLWLQMMADVFNTDIYISENHHGAAWGAAWTGLVALGEAASFQDIKHNIPKGSATKPQPARVKLYAELFANYERLGYAINPLHR